LDLRSNALSQSMLSSEVIACLAALDWKQAAAT
jgi:hypothetical protein